jgi:hypothetical protein
VTWESGAGVLPSQPNTKVEVAFLVRIVV